MEKQEALLRAKALVNASDNQDFFGAKDLQRQLDENIFQEDGKSFIFRFDGESLVQDEI